jgi:hypothetical protein
MRTHRAGHSFCPTDGAVVYFSADNLSDGVAPPGEVKRRASDQGELRYVALHSALSWAFFNISRDLNSKGQQNVLADALDPHETE